MSQVTTEAPAAPTVSPVLAPATSTDPRSGDGSTSRPAGPENITGADLRADFAKRRQARRAPAPAAQSQQGTPAKPVTEEGAAVPAAADTGTSPTESNATSTPPADGAVIDALTQPAPTDTPDPQHESQPAETGEPDLEAILDDPENLSEDAIKGIRDKSIRRLVGRIHKLTARLKAAEKPGAQANEPAQQAVANGDPELAPLDQRMAEIQEAMTWALANRDGGEWVDGQGKTRTLTPAQVEMILVNGPAQLAAMSGKKAVREETLRQQREQSSRAAFQAAVQAHPWLGKQDSEEYAQAAAVLQQAPYLQQHPEWPMWLADAIEGRKARLSREAGPQVKPTAARPVPPRVPPPAASAAPRIDPTQKALAEAEAAFEKSGDSNDHKRVLALRLQVKRRMAAALPQ